MITIMLIGGQNNNGIFHRVSVKVNNLILWRLAYGIQASNLLIVTNIQIPFKRPRAEGRPQGSDLAMLICYSGHVIAAA